MKKILAAVVAIVFVLGCNKNTEYKAYLKDPLRFSQTVHELNRVVMGNIFHPSCIAIARAGKKVGELVATKLKMKK